MANRQRGQGEVATQVRQVERELRRAYVESGFLDVDDLQGQPEEYSAPRLLSRSLAAQAVRIVTGFSRQEAAATVIDGPNDQGIDAIAVVEGANPHVYVVQAKWSKNGKASSDRAAVKELIDGLRIIDDEDFAAFNPRGRQLAEHAKTVLDTGTVPVTQVVVLMRADPVTDGFHDALEVGERDFNRHRPILDNRIILAAEVWRSIRDDLKTDPVELEVELFPWFSGSSPYEYFQGVADTGQVANWGKHGSSLFHLNIRNPLGSNSINNTLVDTLKEEPAYFWYFNNGITILCESVERHVSSMRMPEKSPVALTLHNASVVNGAQTVRSIADAVAQSSEAAEGQVGVRIIVTGTSSDFAKKTTQATNRQNRVEPRDFIALDRVQSAIFEEMRAELGLEYSVQRSELDPLPETGCSVVEAACALACAHRDPQYAARISVISSDALWERGPQGMYDNLFHPQPGVYLLWNAVSVLRTVREKLHELRGRYEGRGAALIEHGVYLLTHLVIRRLDTEGMDDSDPSLTWSDGAKRQARDLVEELVPALSAAIDEVEGTRSQIRAVCSDAARCRGVVEYVLTESNKLSAEDKYRRSTRQRKRRRPNAVPVIIDQGLLEEGEPLALTTPTSTESEALRSWLAEHPERGRATWVPQRSKPILWSADGRQYSPSGLVFHIWELAGWEQRPVAVQGPARWATSSGATLAEHAWHALGRLEEEEQEQSDESTVDSSDSPADPG